MDKFHTCCFTGHREVPRAQWPGLYRRLEETIRHLNQRGFDTFLAGGALGFDTMAARMTLHLRQEGLLLRLVLALPCQGQESRWPLVHRQRYEEILAQADDVVCLSDHYYRGCMQNRNRYMVERSSCCVAYQTKPTGGTVQTVGLCLQQNVPVIHLRYDQPPDFTPIKERRYPL